MNRQLPFCCMFTEPLIRSEVVTSTTISVRGENEDCLLFEESLLDDNHCVAVCSRQSDQSATNSISADLRSFSTEEHRTRNSEQLCREVNLSELVKSADKTFTEITAKDLLTDLDIINNSVDMSVWTNFNNKQYSAR